MQRLNPAPQVSVISRSPHTTQPGFHKPAVACDRTGRPLRTGTETPWRRRAFLAIGAVSLLSLAACAGPSGSNSVEGKSPSGYVEMRQVQAAYIGSGSTGHGTLRFRGNTYPFSVSGLGIGGIGVSTIDARGEVYGLKRLSDFPGAYAQGRIGFALGTKSAGDLWLKNEKGGILRLVAKRKGLMLSLGGDAVVISML